MAVANLEHNDAAMGAAYALLQIADDLIGRPGGDVGDNDANHNNHVDNDENGNEYRGENEIENENWGENGNENREENGMIEDGGEDESEIEDEIEIGNQNPPRYRCDFCGHVSKKRAHSVTHKRTHTKEKPFECQECDRKFARSDMLKRHVSTVHRKLRPYVCSRCDKSFGRKDHLDKHMDTHTKVIVIEPTDE